MPKPRAANDLDKLLEMYRVMVRIRAFEAALTAQSQAGNLRGSLHLAAGQEAVPAGACAALTQGDYFTVTYRGHGYIVAKGCDLNKVVAEILGRETGLCRGKGGKMHLMDLSHGLLGANGIVAGGMGAAVGGALTAKLDQNGRVAITVFGDGALNQGHAHEVMNIAALWKLPMIFLCENNLYAEMTPLSRSTAVTELTEKMRAYGIHAVQIDGNDPLVVYRTVAEARERGLRGEGPTFIEALTYRTCGHYQNDPGTAYRTRDEVKEWEANSPIVRAEKTLVEGKKATPADLKKIDDEERRRVDDAVKFALDSPFPKPESHQEHVFI